MTNRFVIRRSVSLSAVLAVVLLAAASVIAEEKAPAAGGDGPLLIALAPEKPQSKKFNLRYQLKSGEVLRYDVTHRASIRSTIEQQTQAAQTRTDSVKCWKVTDVLKSGEIEFVSLVESVHMVNQLPDKDPTEYDSERDKVAPPGFEDAARNVGVPLSIVRMSPTGKIVRRDSKIPGAKLEEDAPIALRLPEKPVAIGDTWDESFDIVVKLDKGGSKSIQTRRHHELASVNSGIATIKVTYQILSPIDSTVESQLVERLLNGEVKFDIKAGRVVSQQYDIDKRILGFAGPTSSMQYVMRMEEKLLKKGEKVAAKPAVKTAATQTPATSKTRTASKPGTKATTIRR